MNNVTMDGIVKAMAALGDHWVCSETCPEICPYSGEKSLGCPMRKMTKATDEMLVQERTLTTRDVLEGRFE